MWPSPSPGPSRRALLVLVLAVLLLHGLLLVTDPLTVKIGAPASLTPVQVRLVSLPPPAPALPATPAAVRLRKPVPAPVATPVQAVETPPVARATSEATVAELPPEPAPAASEALADRSTAPASEGPLVDAAAAQKTTVQGTAPPVRQDAAAPAPQAVSATAPSTTPDAAGTPWPPLSPGALPPSRLLSYQLTGMDKGLTYHASGELRWQHNETDYELTLAVRAFLIGRRQWRSVGRIDATGLAPLRFSDSWRNERAAHFDRERQRIVFSSNSTPAVLEAGAQDQISLYVQLAAAMASQHARFAPGTRLQVQTATVRDAQPWSLVLEGDETLMLEGQSLPVLKWTCQPRNRFEARVEFWVAAQEAWLPLRIRITQAQGSFIDLAFRSAEPLPPLPVQGDAKGGGASS